MTHKKILLCAIFAAISLFTVSCQKDDGNEVLPADKTVKIAVITDLHYFDISLLKNRGTAFEQYLMGDRKLIEESSAIAESLIASLLQEKPDVVLVSGDLTKDGEKSSHQKLIVLLDKLRAAGVQVVVTPGNHDINNPHSVLFDGATTQPTPTVSADEFRTMYSNFGFANAIATGPDLCYVSEPVQGLWIISIDACEYKENLSLGTPVTKGSLSNEKLDWVESQTQKGLSQGKKVMAIMHHGAVEHFAGQQTMFSEYLVENWDAVSTRFANAGLGVVFTGHFHAQDIVKKSVAEGKFIFDIETGSTVTAPCPYRIVELKGDVLTVTSKTVQSINFAGIPAGQTFAVYANKFLSDGMLVISKYMLMGQPYNVPEAQAAMVAPLFAETFIAHYKGDETQPSAQTQPILTMLLSDNAFAPIAQAVQSVWTDTAPSDNSVVINLKTGIATNSATLVRGESKTISLATR